MKHLLMGSLLLLSLWAPAQTPRLSFFNEQEGPQVQALFADTTLIPALQELGAEIRMGMLDLSPERAAVLRELNQAGVPVVAWLLLPKEQGYWFHSGNAAEAFARYYEIRDWAQKEGIRFSGIGIDLELDRNDIELFQNSKLKLLGKVIGRLYGKEDFLQANADYRQLIQTVRGDGYPIESYYVPFIRYETQAGRTALQQATGFMDLETDKDIPMLYTSFMGNAYGTLKVLALDENLKQVAIGSTGGGFDPSMPSMSWDELAYDLRLASRTAEEIHIFCLEATVEKGFLPRLVGFDYSAPVAEHPEQVAAVQALATKVMGVSAALSYPSLVLGGILLLLALLAWGLFRFFKWGRRRMIR